MFSHESSPGIGIYNGNCFSVTAMVGRNICNVTWRLVSPEKRGWQFVLKALSSNRKENKLVHLYIQN